MNKSVAAEATSHHEPLSTPVELLQNFLDAQFVSRPAQFVHGAHHLHHHHADVLQPALQEGGQRSEMLLVDVVSA